MISSQPSSSLNNSNIVQKDANADHGMESSTVAADLSNNQQHVNFTETNPMDSQNQNLNDSYDSLEGQQDYSFINDKKRMNESSRGSRTDTSNLSDQDLPTLDNDMYVGPEEQKSMIDPSQDSLHAYKLINNDLQSQNDQKTVQPHKICFKLRYPQPLTLNEPWIIVTNLEKKALKYLLLTCAICYFFGRYGCSWLVFTLTCGSGLIAFYMLSNSVLDSLYWQIEKLNGAKKLADCGSSDSMGESMEWLNDMLSKIWRSIDPKVFATVEDILEDTLVRVAPKIIKAAKVNDFDLGSAAPRIEKMQIFPPTSNQSPDSIFGEISFSLRTDSSSSAASKTKTHFSTPPGASIRFKSSVYAAVDVRAELIKFTGNIRFKIVTSPEPPFVSQVVISFTKAPVIETAVMPITKKLNIMGLPMLHGLVNEGVKLGFKPLVDPNTIDLDIAQIMAAQLDTSAIGLVKVEVRQLKNMSPTSEDPENLFVTLSLSKIEQNDVQGTRILTNKIDPYWNENLYQLVALDDIKNDVYVNIKIFKSDKLGTDVMYGSISASVRDIVLGKLDEVGNITNWCTKERVMFDGWAPVDDRPENSSRIMLNFKLSFHPKYIIPNMHHPKTELARRKAEREKQAEKKKSEGLDISDGQKKLRLEMGDELKEIIDTKLEHPIEDISQQTSGQSDLRKNNKSDKADVTLASNEDAGVNKTQLVASKDNSSRIDNKIDEDESDDDMDIELGEPVSREHISGILSIRITEGKDIEIMDPDLFNSKERRHPYKPGRPVNPYAIIYINDQKIYRTRAKMSTPNPCWNADTECFLKNYETAYVRISVKTSIDLEQDPVIGTVVFKISELFEKGRKKVKKTQRWVGIGHGIGFGQVFLDLTYKPIKLTLPKELLGAEVGTLVIESVRLSNIKNALDSQKASSTKATFALNVESKITKELDSNLLQEQTDGIWAWAEESMYFPLLMRYKTALFIHLSQGMTDGKKVTACLWMKEILDYDWQEAVLALRDYTSEVSDEANRNELPWGSDGPHGSIIVRIKFIPGFSPVHTSLPSFTTDMLGADPFQKDDTWEKAHLLVRQEGSEHYAINVPEDTVIDNNKRQPILDTINKHQKEGSCKGSLSKLKHKKDQNKHYSLNHLSEEQKQELINIRNEEQLHKGGKMPITETETATATNPADDVPYYTSETPSRAVDNNAIIESSYNSQPIVTNEPVTFNTDTFDIFNEKSYSSVLDQPTITNPDLENKRASLSSTVSDRPVNSFDVLRKNTNTTVSNNGGASVRNEGKRDSTSSSSSSNVPISPTHSFNYGEKRNSVASTSSSGQHADNDGPYVKTNIRRISTSNMPMNNDRLNGIMEIETVPYLDSMKDNLSNSKIHNTKVMRKLSKGKDYIQQQINTLRQGHNNESRAKQSVKKEV
ncbi:uncharacterized protein BX663DRAFT_501057 [Cokeromyces recurvatus]|uniref:uncharacterized protein n=1 Tax=Cokeromyces recurvatus TaxID=90255 RepID=UPI00221F40EA|nr:uncharacterized protein BX663DRAFT_501057 [Cokeromyces recurvatus]KAI7904926.1 hypothetical protein BX663DRAFT_501057 [Cokeromyces recurvatus]